MGHGVWTDNTVNNAYLVYGNGKRYELWRYNLRIYSRYAPTLLHKDLSDLFLDPLKPTEEEAILWELEIGIPFPPMKMYTDFINSRRKPARR